MSIVSVDNIQPIGSGTSVTVNSAATLVLKNVNSSGVVTATSFYGDGSNLSGVTQNTINDNAAERVITGSATSGELNASDKLTLASNGIMTLNGQLIVDQVNINDNVIQTHTNNTNLKLRGTGDGIVELDDNVTVSGVITATSFSGSGANLTGLISGITEFDYWYLTTSVTSDSDLTSNLTRNDRAGITPSERIGTGMSESGGVFTFPNTGKWLVFVIGGFIINGTDSVALDTQVTTNNSSYSTHARVNEGNNGSGARSGSGTSLAFLDVTDTSQVKVKFNVNSLSSGSYLIGNTASYISTAFIFVRIGDT